MSMAAVGGGGMDGSDGGKGGDDWKRKKEVSFVLSSDDEEEVDVVETSSSEDDDDDDDDETDVAPAALEKKSNNANYIGKSKSYGNLDALNIKNKSKDVEKEEQQPLNKKRKLALAKKRRRRDFLSTTTTSLTGSHETSFTKLPAAVKNKRRSKITFNRERTNESRSRNQNRLTRLGKNVIAWKKLSVKKKWCMTPDLKTHRMERLKTAKMLRIRNGEDIEAVVYLIKECCFSNKVEVPDMNILKRVKRKLKVRSLRERVKFAIRAPFSSDEDSYRLSDQENGSVDGYDSDDCVRTLKEEVVDIDCDEMSYLEFKNEEEGSDSDPNYDHLWYGEDTDSSSDDY